MANETRSVVVKLRAEANGFVVEFNNATRASDRLGHSVGRSSNLISNMFKRIAVYSAAAGLGKVAIDAVKLEATFSRTMAQIAAQTKAPQQEMDKLDKLALKLGADTVFSAQDAADAMLELAKGGLTPAQIQAGALADSLTLAAAGGLELGDAADAVVNAMGAFHLKATQTDVAINALAGGANASSANVSDMTQALAQAGQQADASGLSIADTTGILAAFANNGIKGSDAGTSLKTMLQNLQPQTKRQAAEMARLNLSFVDAHGNFVSAEQIAGRLQTSLKGLTQSQRAYALQQIFGTDASRAANILANEGAAGIAKYIRASEDQTSAQRLAKASMSGTAGALQQLSGSIETAEIQIGKGLAPVIQDLATKTSDLVSGGDFEKWTREGVAGVRDLVHELTPLAIGSGHLAVDVFPLLVTTGKELVEVLVLAAKVVTPLIQGFDKLPDSAQKALILGAALLILSRRTQELQQNTSGAILNLRTMPTEMRNTALKAAALRTGIGAAGIGLSVFGSELGDTGSGLGTLTSVLGAAATGFAVGGPWGLAILGGISLLGSFGKSNKQAIGDVSALTASLDDQTAAVTKNTREIILNSLNKKPAGGGKSAFEIGNEIGFKPSEITDAALGNKNLKASIAASIDAALQNLGDAGTPGADTAQGRELLKLADALDLTTRRLSAARAEKLRDIEATKGSIELNKLSAKQITAVAKATHGVPKEAITRFTQPGFAGAEANIVRIAKRYHLSPKQVTTAMKTLDYASPQIRRVQSMLQILNATSVAPTIHIKDDASATIARIQRKINGLHGTTAPINAGLFGLNKYTGGQVPAGYAGGGRVPGTAPADPNMDNVLAYGFTTGNPLLVRSGEWIINEPQSKKNDPWLRAMNNGLVLDDYLRGTGGISGRYAKGRPTPVLAGAFAGTSGSGPSILDVDVTGLRVSHDKDLRAQLEGLIRVAISNNGSYNRRKGPKR